MMNLQNAVRQMRVARRLGKLSESQQKRIMRRINPRPSQLRWERNRAFLAQIHAEIAPELAKQRQAEREVFQIKCDADAELPEEKAIVMTHLQMRLMDSKNRCLAKMDAAERLAIMPKKRGRKSKAEKALIEAAKAEQAAKAAEPVAA